MQFLFRDVTLRKSQVENNTWFNWLVLFSVWSEFRFQNHLCYPPICLFLKSLVFWYLKIKFKCSCISQIPFLCGCKLPSDPSFLPMLLSPYTSFERLLSFFPKSAIQYDLCVPLSCYFLWWKWSLFTSCNSSSHIFHLHSPFPFPSLFLWKMARETLYQNIWFYWNDI